MAYILYSLSFFCLVVIGVLFLTRGHWYHRLPDIPILRRVPFIYTAVPSSFEDDAAAGLQSSTFDLSGNIESGDSRKGLDEQGKKDVQRIMKTRGVGFDEARRIVFQEKLRRAGVGPDGKPRDPKFVSFS